MSNNITLLIMKRDMIIMGSPVGETAREMVVGEISKEDDDFLFIKRALNINLSLQENEQQGTVNVGFLPTPYPTPYQDLLVADYKNKEYKIDKRDIITAISETEMTENLVKWYTNSISNIVLATEADAPSNLVVS